MAGFTLEPFSPVSHPKPSTKLPDSSSGAITVSENSLPNAKSSSPAPGAIWTIPVPSSSLTSFQGITW